MRIWPALIVLGALLVSAAVGRAQTATTSVVPGVAITPAGGDLATAHQLEAHGLPPGSDVLVVLFDPQGTQTVLHGQSDGSGALSMGLQPPGGSWQIGVYRAVVALPQGQAISATFSANDGGRHFAVGPDLPSPTSAFVVTGVGLPANSQLRLLLVLAGGLGERDLAATTDATGSLSTFVWPQEEGFDFWSAGRYELQVPQFGLDTPFFVREHPSTSFITFPPDVTPGSQARFDLSAYGTGRYLWLLAAGLGGQAGAEFLLGPTDARGFIESYVLVPNLAPGTYALGTPYDWGETTFTVPQPTGTPTATPTISPTATVTPTATATATRTARPTAKPTSRAGRTCKARKGRKKACKR